MRKSCIVVSNSPPFGLPSRECADDYLDKTVEQLAEEMGQKVKKNLLCTCFGTIHYKASGV